MLIYKLKYLFNILEIILETIIKQLSFDKFASFQTFSIVDSVDL